MEKTQKIVDVAINVCGKPFQTLTALKTLMFHSGTHIDNIYYIQENFNHPYDDGGPVYEPDGTVDQPALGNKDAADPHGKGDRNRQQAQAACILPGNL